jgi:hypothetical protein
VSASEIVIAFLDNERTTLEADASSSHATREPSVKTAREDGSRLA